MKSMTLVGAIALALMGAAVSAHDTKEAQAVASAKLSMTEAIAIAEKKANGKAIDVEVETSKAGQAQYAVEVLSSDGKKLTEYKLDANTGNVDNERNEPLEKFVNRVKPQDLQNAQTSLSAAIRTAERQSGGKVIDAETEGSGNTLRYELEVAKSDGKTEEIEIDGATGKVAMK
jgi:uncharacterized membrane protein YkoI